MKDDYFFVNFFHIQILLAAFLFIFKMPKRSHFYLRLFVSVLPYVLLPFLLPGGFLNTRLQIGNVALTFFLMLVLLFFVLWICFSLTPLEILFYICSAQLVQHSSHCLAEFFSSIFSLTPILYQVLLLIFFVSILFLSHFAMKSKIKTQDDIAVSGKRLIVFTAISSILIYIVSYLATKMGEANIWVFIFDFFSCFLLLALLFDLLESHSLQKQNVLMQLLLEQSQEQDSLFRESIETVNRKCHDLKHQISALRQMESKSEKEESISQLEEAVLFYDQFAKTGLKSLDVLLAQKALQGEKNGISLRYMVDGSLLAFMRTEDIFTLFGNAIDNAMEAVLNVEKAERIIFLKAAEKFGCLSVHIENPSPASPVFKNGLPLSTKNDKDYHGFGILSIKLIAEKYGGTLFASWNNGTFSLDLLFPLSV